MARPRKQVVRVRKRDYKAEYARRQARARELGFEGYYGRRIRRGQPAEVAAPRGERLRAARGHASGGDLRSQARDGDLLIGSLGGRNALGRYTRVDITLVGSDGGEKEYVLQGKQLGKAYLQRLVSDLEAAGVIFSPAPSLDLRRIAGES